MALTDDGLFGGGSSDDSSGGDSGGSSGDGGGTSVPDWVFSPASKIKSIVGSWIASRISQGIIAGMSTVLWALYQPFVIIEDTHDVAERALLDATGPAGDAILDAIRELNTSIADAAVGGGVAAPLLVWTMWVLEAAVVVYLLVQLAKLLDPR
jgi:hypothetical protein